MVEQQIKPEILKFLPELAPFTAQQASRCLYVLEQPITIGLKRIEGGKLPTEEDGGLLAIRFPVLPPKIEQIQASSVQPILAGVFAGENWKAEVCEWTGRDWQKPKAIFEKPISERERIFSGPNALNQFTDLMAQVSVGCLQKARLEEQKRITQAAISFGFPQENWRDDKGVNACLVRGTKHWSIEGGLRKALGKSYLSSLERHGYDKVKRYFFANDTIGTALDILAGSLPGAIITPEGELLTGNFTAPGAQAVLPVGVVIGNGANVAIQYRDQLVNLEIGQAKIEQLFGKDPILLKMKELGLTPEGEEEMRLEFAFSGAYQLPRLIGALRLLSDKGLVKREIGESFLRIMKDKGNDPKILDQLIVGEVDQKGLIQYLGQSISEEDFAYVKEVAHLVMGKAVELAALMIAGPLKVGGWDKGYLPVVGSVFWKAKVGSQKEVFGQEVIKLVNKWLKSCFGAVLADELRGLAGLALTAD